MENISEKIEETKRLNETDVNKHTALIETANLLAIIGRMEIRKLPIGFNPLLDELKKMSITSSV